MKKIRILLVGFLLITTALIGTVALASDITGAIYKLGITISNNSTLANNVAVTANISSSGLIAGHFMNSSGNNTVMLDAGDADAVFMPGHNVNPWCMWVPIIGADSYLNYDLYTAESTGGDIAYFPGAGGMSVSDDATLELGNAFNTEGGGYIDIDSNGDVVSKFGAFGVRNDASGEISGIIYFAEAIEVTPGAGVWNDVDVSDYVGDDATGVILHLTTTAALINSVRMNGSVQNITGDVAGHTWAMVGLDANMIFDSYVEHAVNCDVWLTGYTTTGAVYKVAMDNVGGGFGAWEDYDASTTCPDAIGIIVYVDNTDAANPREYGLQHNDSTDDRKYDIVADGNQWGIVGCDSNQVIEKYREVAGVDLYVAGYFTADSGFTFNVNGVDKSLGVSVDWQDIDLSANVPIGTKYAVFEVYDGGAHPFGLRRKGSTEVIQTSTMVHGWAVVEVSNDRIVECWVNNAATDWWLIGYTTSGDAPFQTKVSATGISSGEQEVISRGAANYPQWATGDVLQFNEVANSEVDCGAIYNAQATLWIDFWFKLDAPGHAAGGGTHYLFGKVLHFTNDLVTIHLGNGTGQLYFTKRDAAAPTFQIVTVQNAWVADQRYHVLASISAGAGARLRIDNAAAQTDPDNSAVCNGGDFIIGDRGVGAGAGLDGTIINFISGTDDLTAGEELDLYAGIAPGDETDYWYIDEGTGTTITSYGSAANAGTRGAATSWTTATYTAGNTGRLCDFTLEVDGDRWGKNLKGVSVPDNTNGWTISRVNAMPYMDYYQASGQGLQFNGAANSEVDCGAIYDATAKLWSSFWFRLPHSYIAGSGTQYLFGKAQAWATDFVTIHLGTGTGQLYFTKEDGGVQAFQLISAETSWTAGQWYHVLASISSAAGARLRIDNGAALTDADVSAVCNGGDFVIGDRGVGVGAGAECVIANFAVGTDDLTIDEEIDLYNGIIPSDATNIWYMDEGTGVDIIDYGTGGNDGTAGAACTWVGSGSLMRSAWEWEYNTTFHDSIGSNDATPTFRTTSSDADVIGTAVTFQPIEEAKAPPWVLDTTPATWLTAANVTGNFTTTVSPTYPGADVVTAIANASGTPTQLPFTTIFTFLILAVSLCFSAVMRKSGSGNLWVKIILIASLMWLADIINVFDFWMMVMFLFIALALAAASMRGRDIV